MSQYYTAKRKTGLYNPKSSDVFRLSRTKIDLFLECPRCFYIDRKLGVSRPPGFPMSLNTAVDELLKKEFDIHRAKGSKHPLMEAYGIEAVPFNHEKIDEWRDSMHRGVSYIHGGTKFLLTGGIDDVWVNKKNELIVVDYKATSKNSEVTIDADWQHGYKRQIEFYQWLFKKNGFKVSHIGYFVYCNGKTDKQAFDGKLEFDIKIIPYEGNDSWVEPTILAAKVCLDKNEIPEEHKDCDYCSYINAVFETKATLF